MAKSKERKVLDKKNWVQNFTLVGKVVLDDKTFTLDERSNKSDWIYNMLNLKLDCGEKYGKKINCKLMGGYSNDRNNIIYVHGKTSDNRDDFDNSYTIDWNDRFDKDILDDIGDLCFIKIGIEKDTHDEVVVNKFLHAYDAIAYIAENIHNGDEVKVKGRLKYSIYQDAVQVEREIGSIYLKRENENYVAEFTQTVLLDKGSLQKPDKDKCVFPINAYVLEKFKEYNGNDLTEGGAVKGGKLVPLCKTFEYEYDPDNLEKAKKIVERCFKVKAGVTKATFIGVFKEGGALITATEDDLSDDAKELIDIGVYTLEEVLAKCAQNGGRERRMLFVKPMLKQVGDEDNKTLQVQIFDKEYSEEDLVLDYLVNHDEDADDEIDEAVVNDVENDDDSWLDIIG